MATVDLTIPYITIEQPFGSVPTGNHLRGTVVVENIGDMDYNTNFDVILFVSDNSVFDLGDYEVWSSGDYYVSAGGSRVLEYSFSIPPGTVQQDYYLFATVITDGSDTDPSNNDAGPFVLTVHDDPDDYPDMAFSNLQFEFDDYSLGDTVNYSFDYENLNPSVGTINDVQVSVSISDGSYHTGSMFSDAQVNLGQVSGGDSGTFFGSFTLMSYSFSTDPETFHASISTGWQYNIHETNLRNNNSDPFEFTLDGGSSEGLDEGVHNGWYYQVESFLMSETEYHMGWYYDYHQVEADWMKGWHVGYYLSGGTWLYGWNNGWFFGSGWSLGWYYGWGAKEVYSWHFQLGDLVLADPGWGFYGWQIDGFEHGIGWGRGTEDRLFGRRFEGEIGVSDPQIGVHWDYGWVNGWYQDAALAWQNGWHLGWYQDDGAYANVYLSGPIAPDYWGSWGWHFDT